MHKSNSTKVGKTLLNHCIDQGGGGDVSKREMYILFFSKIVWKFKKKKKKKKMGAGGRTFSNLQYLICKKISEEYYFRWRYVLKTQFYAFYAEF